jgi:hypothetical protein
MKNIVVAQHPFEFYGIKFLLYQINQNKLVIPIQHACEKLGVSEKAEIRRLKADDILRDSLISVTAPINLEKGQIKRAKVICIVVEVFPYWLAMLNVSKINRTYRNKIAQYQMAVREAWWWANISEILPDTLNLDQK